MPGTRLGAPPSLPMTSTKNLLRLGAAVVLAAGASFAHADWRPDGVVVEAGLGRGGLALVGAGLSWDWNWRHALGGGGELSARTELLLNEWRADDFGGGHQNFTQVALLPTLRLDPVSGGPLYLEAGVGLSLMDPLYVTPRKTFSTRFNFYDVIGIGWRLGPTREVGLRINHVSNAGIKNPNPGEEFVQVRFLQRF